MHDVAGLTPLALAETTFETSRYSTAARPIDQLLMLTDALESRDTLVAVLTARVGYERLIDGVRGTLISQMAPVVDRIVRVGAGVTFDAVVDV